ncbi:hypothetical protein KMW28_20755 [Flammeovirga yaeyamensis]|uniref:Uncharacterized protein n=1 Tax=Flammeovirga yaeyamensis TaxID=367791 RepID=A0AAX1NBH2_9BACT|nr:hypothetical protein [Flammeovirga yaeyamensis]MBB3697224.1 hypothetical protein [Flammeovirga yaeyamensis]NMF33883.1 hypothetical protein [Flammeovirga yaeyamensis]QWG04857.1 hypothetical protein KMW28_20755 [Flammeovirga yaeyamensis]
MNKIKTKLLLLLLLFPTLSFCQDVLDEALKDKSNIILEEPFTFNLKDKNIDSYLYYMNHASDVFNDTTLLKSLIQKTKKPDKTYWKQENFFDKVIVAKGQNIHTKAVLKELSLLSDEELKLLKKEIRKYNNRNNEWRSYPLKVSKPIYSDDNKYAIIGIIKGNNGSEISLFELKGKQWVHLGYLERKVF